MKAKTKRWLCSWILLLIPVLTAYAQKEGSIWYVGPQSILNFNFQPPQLKIENTGVNSGQVATIADRNGNLLFYSDGINVFTRNHSVMPNGQTIAKPAIGSVVIIPKPGNPVQYFVITSEGSAGFPGLKYVIADITRNGGLGEVVSRDQRLADTPDLYLTVAANCDRSMYWIISQLGSDFYAFKVDRSGISTQPVITSFDEIGYFSYQRFAPSGDKLAFLSFPDGRTEVNLADFDFTTGQITNRLSAPVTSQGTALEFSSNSRVLYVASQFDSTITQLDVSSRNAAQIQQSATAIYKAPDAKSRINGPLQLGSDGKIYIKNTLDGEIYLSTIDNPNRIGLACGFTPKALALGNDFAFLSLASIVTGFFREGLPVEAGPDTLVCPNTGLVLGGASDNTVTYRWSPADHLSNANIPRPTFRYNQTTADTVRLTYVLTASKGICFNTDTVRITVRPSPATPLITGSRSVCPRVEGVAYWVARQPGLTYQWTVSGGELVSGQGTDSITVDWGPSNANAGLRVVATNAYGCVSEMATFPVRINVELQTDTPRGENPVCLNTRDGNAYRVTNTRGSVYTWGITGG